MKDQWIHVTEHLPTIPEGQYGVSVITALFDEHEALVRISNNGPNADLSPCYYMSTDTFYSKDGWKDYDEQGGVLNFFKLTHWMYKPNAPDVPDTVRQQLIQIVAELENEESNY